jgi:hypothetical protein
MQSQEASPWIGIFDPATAFEFLFLFIQCISDIFHLFVPTHASWLVFDFSSFYLRREQARHISCSCEFMLYSTTNMAYSYSKLQQNILGGMHKPNSFFAQDADQIAGCEKKVPRFLFKAFGPDSGKTWMPPHKRTIYRDLNTEICVAPHAIITGKGHSTIYNICNPGEILMEHFRHGLNEFDEFSSWSPSLFLVLKLVDNKLKEQGDAHICVLDTHRAPNQILPSKDHLRAAGGWKDYCEYNEVCPHEFMVQGQSLLAAFDFAFAFRRDAPRGSSK